MLGVLCWAPEIRVKLSKLRVLFGSFYQQEYECIYIYIYLLLEKDIGSFREG